jgi:hypothetical protein
VGTALTFSLKLPKREISSTELCIYTERSHLLSDLGTVSFQNTVQIVNEEVQQAS